MARRKDFLDEVVAGRTKANPRFPELVEAALERRKLLRELAARREASGISQTVVAAAMGTSQSAVARIESGEADVRLSTVERYAAAVGSRVTWTVAGASHGRAGKARRGETSRPTRRAQPRSRSKV